MSFLIVRILKQIHNDKRLVALVVLAPILMLSLIYLLLGNSSYKPIIATDMNSSFVSELKKQDCTVITLDTNKMDEILKNKTADAALFMKDGKVTIKLLENDAIKAGLVSTAVKDAASKINPNGSMVMTFLYGKTTESMFDSLGFIMLGITSFFFVFIIAGISFVRERTGGTLERFILSPIKRWQIVAGYTIAFGILAIIQSFIILAYSLLVLKMNIGSVLLETAVVMICLSLSAVALGSLISIFSNNEFQIVQFIPIIVIPQIFFSGIIPLDTIPLGLGNLAYVMPVYYACNALKKLVVYKQGFADIAVNLVVLLGIVLVLSIINTLALKRYRKI